MGRRMLLFVLSLSLFVVSAMYHSGIVSASPIHYWSILPGYHTGNDIYEFGYHFDESNKAYGALDYNRDSGSSVQTYVRAFVVNALPWPVRYNRVSLSSCDLELRVEFQSGGNWFTLSGGHLHYFHITGQSTGVTSSMQGISTSITDTVGTPNSTCWNPAHLHQSADLSGGLIIREHLSGETCWIDTDGWQCPDTYPRDNPMASCPPGSSSGTDGVSGNITRYICQSWSKEYRANTATSFRYRW